MVLSSGGGNGDDESGRGIEPGDFRDDTRERRDETREAAVAGKLAYVTE